MLTLAGVRVSREDHTRSLMPVGLRVLVRTAHGCSLPFVFHFLVRTAWSLTPIHVPDEDRTWSLTPPGVSISSEHRTWSLTSVGVRVFGEDRTWSLTPICVPISDEDRTWSLMPISVLVSGEDFSWSLTPQPTLVFSFNSPLHHASEKAVVKGRIMSWT